MDDAGIDRAGLVWLSIGARHALQFAARHPDRPAGVVAMGRSYPSLPLPADFDVPKERYEGWDKYNRHAWRTDWPGWVEHFMTAMFPEPHSTKQIEDGVAWGLETDGDVLALTSRPRALPGREEA